MGVIEEDKLLEVACGQGVGSVLAMTEFHPKEMHGIDFSKAQISRAKKVNSEIIEKNFAKFFFHEGAAGSPYDSNSFEKVFFIEAAQHFERLEKFAKEANRVLKYEGRLAIASFFGTSGKFVYRRICNVNCFFIFYCFTLSERSADEIIHIIGRTYSNYLCLYFCHNFYTFFYGIGKFVFVKLDILICMEQFCW